MLPQLAWEPLGTPTALLWQGNEKELVCVELAEVWAGAAESDINTKGTGAWKTRLLDGQGKIPSPFYLCS